jgi:hypothetical protein
MHDLSVPGMNLRGLNQTSSLKLVGMVKLIYSSEPVASSV